jgi:hypothetical protein
MLSRKGNVPMAHAIDQTRPSCNDLAPPQDAAVGISDSPASRKRKRTPSIGELLVGSFEIRVGLLKVYPRAFTLTLTCPISHT